MKVLNCVVFPSLLFVHLIEHRSYLEFEWLVERSGLGLTSRLVLILSRELCPCPRVSFHGALFLGCFYHLSSTGSSNKYWFILENLGRFISPVLRLRQELSDDGTELRILPASPSDFGPDGRRGRGGGSPHPSSTP